VDAGIFFGKLDPKPIEGPLELINVSIGGLMGLVLHPDSEEKG
jgi:hypothetical protein